MYHFYSGELDRSLEQGAKEVDEAKGVAIYIKMEDILNEEVTMLPLYENVDFLVLRKGVQGVGYTKPFNFY